MENSAVKVKAFNGCGTFGVGSDHGVEAEESWVGTLVQDSVGIIQIVGVPDSNGGDKVAGELRNVENAVDEELGVDLLELFESGG